MNIAAIDAGGTTFKCALLREGEVLSRRRISTAEPLATVKACAAFFGEAQRQHGAAKALGIGCFGPLDINEGKIGNTAKKGWSGTPVVRLFEAETGLPVALDLDVHAALLAERISGAAQGCDHAAYITIGTGIGAGLIANGQLLAKPSHPEFGHISVRRHPDDDFRGVCPFHGDCLEGLTSAPALQARFGSLPDLPADSAAWPLAGFYLAQACLTLSYMMRPQRIVMGGGLMESDFVLPQVVRQFGERDGGYLPPLADDVSQMLVRPAYGADAGLIGAYFLALESLGETT